MTSRKSETVDERCERLRLFITRDPESLAVRIDYHGEMIRSRASRGTEGVGDASIPLDGNVRKRQKIAGILASVERNLAMYLVRL